MVQVQDMQAILARQQRVAGRLRALAGSPPQSLVLEGGSTAEREAMALYWACLNNCQNPADGACLDCAPCRQILDRAFNDLLTFPLPEEDKVKVEHIRAKRPVWGQPPRGEGHRVTIFLAAQDLLTEAANTLLKTLEEPRPGNLFVLCAPQRAKLLPTLVSRSFVMTLSWTDGTAPASQAPIGHSPTGTTPNQDAPDQAAPDQDEGQAAQLAQVDELAGALITYWVRRQGWFQRTLAKGAVDAPLARLVVLRCERALASALSGKDDPLSAPLAAMDPKTRRVIGLALEQAGEWLDYKPSPVTPPLVLDWLASRLA